MAFCRRHCRRIVWVLWAGLIPGWLAVAQTATGSTQGPLHVHVVDAVKGTAVADTVVTVDGRVLAADAAGGYELPAATQVVMVRAPGYRAATYAAADVAKDGGALALSPFTVRALYLTEYGIDSRALRDPAFDIIRHGGANALVINIKSDHGMLPYPSQILLATQVGARKLTTIKSLPELVKSGHDLGIYMIARIVTFKDDPVATARPELAIHTNDGGLFKDREGLSWTDPFNEQVRAYNIAIAVEAAKAGFDEVQFDYVRFPDSANKLKVSGPTDEAGRVKAITSFLEEAHKALVPYNVFQSVDIFGYDSWNKNDTGIGQQLEEIAQVADYLCPMLYPSGFQYGIPGHPNPMATEDDIYQTVKLTLDRSLERTKANPKRFRPWLQAFRDYAFGHKVFGPAEVATQMRAAADVGSDGWSLWNARNVYDSIGLAGSKPPAAVPPTTAPASAVTTATPAPAPLPASRPRPLSGPN
jgi:hypothetical protein